MYLICIEVLGQMIAFMRAPIWRSLERVYRFPLVGIGMVVKVLLGHESEDGGDIIELFPKRVVSKDAVLF